MASEITHVVYFRFKGGEHVVQAYFADESTARSVVDAFYMAEQDEDTAFNGPLIRFQAENGYFTLRTADFAACMVENPEHNIEIIKNQFLREIKIQVLRSQMLTEAGLMQTTVDGVRN